MINIKQILLSLSLIFSIGLPIVAPVQAANDQTEIELSVTHFPYVMFTGSAPGSSRFLDNNDISS
jgi:hypothetical protein